MRKLLKSLLILTIVFSIIIGSAAVAVGIMLDSVSRTSIDPVLLNISRSTAKTVFYRYESSEKINKSGTEKAIEEAYISSGVKYRFASYSEIPQTLINAFVAIEDKRFFEHNGIDLYRSLYASANYLLGGQKSFGGSTITQQLIKNLTGNDEMSAARKIREAFAAINLEREYSKTEILEKYLNIINLSNNCRGVGAAAEFYYSKDLEHLTLSECATIAAITNNPSKYDPKTHPENNKTRRNTVLKCMFDQGYITLSEYEDASKSPINLNLSQSTTEDTVNSWYIDLVIEDVINDICRKYSISRSAASMMLYGGGYKIYTAIDHKMQQILDEYFSDLSNFPSDDNGNIPQSSMIVIDPYSGDILAVAGGIGEKRGNRVQNFATDTQRPPGSVIKPLSVYAPAIDRGLIKWSTVISDEPVSEINGKPWPSNADNKYRGNVDVSYAVKHSLNTVAVKLLHEMGNHDSFEFLNKKLGIKGLDSSKDITDSSLALGQPENGVTLREIVSAYTVFTDGIMCRSRSYYKVTDYEGMVILDNASHPERVISTESAAILTKLMQGVISDGTAQGLISLSDSVEVAGKTGTTQGTKDRYFIGYTPQLLAGVWFGYEYPKSLSSFGGNYAAVFWDEVMCKIYEELEYSKSTFSIPEGIVKCTYNAKTGERASPFDDKEVLAEGWFLKKSNHIE